MAAGEKDITIEAGATFRLGLEWHQPGVSDDVEGPLYDLTGCTAHMQLRAGVGTPVLIDLSEGDGIALGGAGGTIDIDIDYLRTGALTAKRAVYDLFILFPAVGVAVAVREKVLRGKVTVEAAVTLATP